MAIELVGNVEVIIGGLDISDHVSGVVIDGATEEVDITTMGASFRAYLLGFKSFTLNVDFFSDFDDNDIDESFYGFWGTTQAFTVKKTKGTAVGATNPSYTGSVLFTSYPVFTANVGQASGGRLSLRGTGVLTRNVT